jgi:hypothetical protein
MQQPTKILLALALAIACKVLCGPSVGRCQADSTLILGSNLNEVTDYSPQLPFINLFLSSREWLTQCRVNVDPGCTQQNAFDTGEAAVLDLDSAGWVRSLPAQAASPVFTQVATIWDVPAEFPKGMYIVEYQGSGAIEYALGARKIAALSTQPGRDVIEVNPERGALLMRITATDPSTTGDYIRNIRVFASDHEALVDSQRFSPAFLQNIQPYEVLRFMDWMRTNNSTVSQWGSRASPTDARFSTEKGVPLEVMLELASVTQKAPWFTIPHQATDEFIQQSATLTRQRLSGSLRVFIEYSNEVWNSAFEQGAAIEQLGQQEWPASPESGFTKRINYYGKRSAEVCRMWKDAFGAEQHRVICVVASQAANSWTADEALRCPLWTGGPCVAQGITALAIAPYFADYLGQEDATAQVLAWGGSTQTRLSRLFSELRSGSQLASGPEGGALAQSARWVADNRVVATTHGVDLITYEGGQHLVGVGSSQNNQELAELFVSANRDQRMYEIYQRYLSEWRTQGGGLFMHFSDISSYTKFGSWGALEQIGQRSSPKYDALREFSPISTNDDPSGPGTNVTLTVRRQAGGSVRSRPTGLECGTICSLSVARGSRIAVIARPKRGFRFVRWSGACSVTTPRCRLVMNRNRKVRAVFRRS